MRQITLSSYFRPVPFEPESHLVTAESPKERLRPSDCSMFAAGVSESDAVQETSKQPLDTPTIRDLITPNVFGDNDLDFFVPPSHPQAAIVRALPSHAARLKSITNALLPVRYPDKFFNECFHDPTVAEFTRVLLWNTQPVGWIRCRLEENDAGRKQIYLQALGILAPYRGYGLAVHLLEQVTTPALIQKYCPTSIYCHVWERNVDAIEWYEKRDFRRVILLDQYYRRLKPAAAWIMSKDLSE